MQGAGLSRRLIKSIGRNLAQRLAKAWASKGLTSYFLLPVSAVYRILTGVRRLLFQSGVFRSNQVNAVIIVVGNVITGGAGKTPTVIEIARHIKGRGLQVGIISRGYGRSSKHLTDVTPNSSPEDAGDEPLLIRQATQCPVIVGSSRFEAATAMLAKHPDVDVILCDDGLQHFGLYRDIEVCVFDDRGIGNGWVLPAGPLREPWPRTHLASCGQSPRQSLTLNTGLTARLEGYKAERSLSPFAITGDGNQIPISELVQIAGKPFYAVAGIAQPHIFFNMLNALRIPLSGAQGFADHDNFAQLDRKLSQNFRLICTEKDAPKLRKLAPDALAIPLEQITEPGFFEALDRLLSESLVAKLPLRHGHKIA
jgi:tetraacyldisaccharide 4'-kinase